MGLDGKKLNECIEAEAFGQTDEQLAYAIEHLPGVIDFLRASGNKPAAFYYTLRLHTFMGYRDARERARAMTRIER